MHYNSLSLQFYQKQMNSLSVALKRKSIEKVQPILPKTIKVREPSPSGRTLYDNFKPAEVLKEFRKKQLYTFGNLSTEKSLSNLNVQEFTMMKQSRFDDDHHNTQSIQQLLDTKMGSNFATSRTKIEETNKKSIAKSQQKLTSQKQSLESDSLFKEQNQVGGEKEQSKQENIDQNCQEGKQENYDDYVLGEKIEEEEEYKQEPKGKTVKKYGMDYNLLAPVDSKQSQIRADYIKMKSQRKRLQQIKEDQEIISLMQKYQNSKQILLNQSKKKHETRTILSSLSKPPKIQKSSSLPSLKPKKQVEIPEVQVYQEDKSKRNLLGKDSKRHQHNSSHLISTLSSGKLGFGRKKIKTICQQDIYEEEMNSLEQIKSKLRSKGITINPNKLTKGLVNIKNELEFDNVVLYPQKRLPSNPIYKKFPL